MNRSFVQKSLGMLVALFVVLAVESSTANAAISISIDGDVYGQNFDTLPASGSPTWTDDSTPPGWFTDRTGNGTTIVANSGGSNAGNLYSYGTETNTDRALGSLGSGNAAVGDLAWGALFQNNTGSSLESVDISYVGEQWRNSAAAAQTVTFYYKVDNLTSPGPPTAAEFNLAGGTAGWTAFTSLDFTSPITGGTAGALDGNLSENQVAISGTLTFGNLVAPGQFVWIGWSDPDHTGADHGLAIDNFEATFHTQEVAAVPEAASVVVWGLLGGVAAAGGFTRRRIKGWLS